MKILMIMPVSIGDVVLTTPTIEAVKKKYSQSTLSYAVQKGPYAQVLENNPYIDKLILLNGNYLDEIRKGNYLQALRKEIDDYPTYDLVINFRDDKGAVNQKDLKNKHAAYYFAKKAGVKIDSIQPRVYIDKIRAHEADEIIEKLQLEKETKLIVISPYCGFNNETNNKRKWSIDNFIFLMNEIGKTQKAKFIIIGAKNDPIVEHPSAINLMGYNLSTVASIISRSHLFIGLDSGMIHIAAAFDVPIVDVLFPSLPELWHPPNNCHVVFCSRRKIRNYTKIEDLKKEQVLKYCQLFLAKPLLKKRMIIRFYPKIRDMIARCIDTLPIRRLCLHKNERCL